MHTPVQLQLRVADADDQDFINTLYFSTRDDLQLLAANPALSNSIAQLISMQQNAQAMSCRQNFPGAETLLMEAGQLPVGRAIVHGSAAVLRLVDISVLPQSRGRGYGGETVRRLQQRAARAGQEMQLSVRLSNTGARRLYAALGFEVVSHDVLDARMRWLP